MDATIGRRQADHDRRALFDAWISTPTWAESRTFLIHHHEALLTDDMVELLASTDHDSARQHLAILNLAAALPTEAVYGIITDPGHAEDAILDALETGDLAQLLPILTAAGSSLSERPLTADLALAVLLPKQNEPERALDVGREIAEHSTAIQLRAYAVRLQSLATNQPDLAGIDDLIAVFELTRSGGGLTGGHVSES